MPDKIYPIYENLNIILSVINLSFYSINSAKSCSTSEY